ADHRRSQPRAFGGKGEGKLECTFAALLCRFGACQALVAVRRVDRPDRKGSAASSVRAGVDAGRCSALGSGICRCTRRGIGRNSRRTRCDSATTARASGTGRSAASHARSLAMVGRGKRVRAMQSFVFCTGQYDSGDWDSAPSLPANLIDSVARYTSISIAPSGVNVPLASDALLEYPLVYLTGHLPLRFSEAERRNVRRLVERGGMLFVDDHNHDVGGVFHNTAFEEIARTFSPLQDLPNDNEIYRSFFQFADGPPSTSHELNGWGDNLVHKNLQAVM